MRRPRVDSCHEEGEGNTAEVLVVFSRLGASSIAGDAEAQLGGHGAVGEERGEHGQRSDGVRDGEHARGGALFLAGERAEGARARRAVAGRRGGPAGARRPRSLQNEGDDIFTKSPLEVSSSPQTSPFPF